MNEAIRRAGPLAGRRDRADTTGHDQGWCDAPLGRTRGAAASRAGRSVRGGSPHWPRRDGDGVSRARPSALALGRAQGARSGARRPARRRAVPRRDSRDRQSAASQHPSAVRQRRGRRDPVLRHAVHRGGVAARAPRARAAAPGGGGGAAGDRRGRRAAVRAQAGSHPPRPQARQHPAAGGAAPAGRLRHRAGRIERRRCARDADGAVVRDAAVHVARAGDGRPRGRCALRPLFAGRGAVRDAHRRATAHGEHGAGDHRPRRDRTSARGAASRGSSVPLHVAAAVERALSKIPADRFASVQEFAEALQGRGAFAHAVHAETPRVASPAARRLA